jgi:hypothetical protein
MTDIHFVMQGKGGVGKTLVASYVSQFLIDCGSGVRCFDTDPVNHSFSQWKALNAETVQILGLDGNVDTEGFDYLFEQLATSETPCVVDAGASTMLPLINYMASEKILEFLHEQGCSTFIHVPIAVRDVVDTLDGFVELVDSSPVSTKIIIWINEHSGGPFILDGNGLEDLDVYKHRKDRVLGIVRLQTISPLYEKDLGKLITKRQTFLEAANDPSHFLMNKRRTYMIWKIITDQLKTVFGIVA